ncbi:MAG: Blue (Type 1) copper domain protein [candidate division WWE3 bacterium GW2011_GWC1_41_7]|jgi:heme/copper-type cytochrome/quinol oxidase subunit 2|uniref:Blue (Type 1) copper domain protein n=4 Tax=Katanobacteria TaxID=422282 RepID=A0A0G0X6H1_UNCKA|nr:MAG: Plastocyanin [candidate division WWE3 bacterium GW2011_GWB1_41_6]KKS20644.1 MAG: Blue (Type 1) copper domain protein [candidate division WWE3 bacterium GW2011_GWC1_41_7]KKS22855.1 MAG: Plastocyanin [candidate division WWE3 bacterium GW2011_GWA1_41_8]OGC56536.1 MAG: hypothetical protein A2976_02980 [candidate division WWE3 bacterium RIFCSPLOWO2_01_FULL_41_9]
MDENKNKNVNPAMIIGVIVVVLLAGYLLYSLVLSKDTGGNELSQSQREQEMTIPEGSNQNEPIPGTQPDVQGTTDVNELDEDVITVELEAGSFYYRPEGITVPVGSRVKIVMTAADTMHNFNIDELGVKIPITREGSTSTVEFTADQVGEFEYYCSVGQHRQNGQVGTLIVEENTTE